MSNSTLQTERAYADAALALAIDAVKNFDIPAMNRVLAAAHDDKALHLHRAEVCDRLIKQFEFRLNKLRREAGEIP